MSTKASQVDREKGPLNSEVGHIRVGNIPQELKDRPQWVCWREELRGGKPTKPGVMLRWIVQRPGLLLRRLWPIIPGTKRTA